MGVYKLFGEDELGDAVYDTDLDDDDDVNMLEGEEDNFDIDDIMLSVDSDDDENLVEIEEVDMKDYLADVNNTIKLYVQGFNKMLVLDLSEYVISGGDSISITDLKKEIKKSVDEIIYET